MGKTKGDYSEPIRAKGSMKECLHPEEFLHDWEMMWGGIKIRIFVCWRCGKIGYKREK